MDSDVILAKVLKIAEGFSCDRPARQLRTALDPADFDALRAAGFLHTGVPREAGGVWESVLRSTRPVCEILRALARGDSSVALVCAMHPAVLSFWLAAPPAPEPVKEAWHEQRGRVFGRALDGAYWGTITSEPGSGGDVGHTKAVAALSEGTYVLTGQKHFGSGSGITSFMLTTAVPDGESDPDWFFVDMRGVPWDGSRGVRLIAEWDGHGMIATQSHGMMFDRYPAERMAFRGSYKTLQTPAAPFIGCLFSAVVAGIVEIAVETARAQLGPRRGSLRPYEDVEWARAEMDGWLVAQAFEGMLRAVEHSPLPHREVLLGKMAIAELAESCLRRICRVMGGGTFGRRSPYGHWFEDVRALGFLRPPWGLAYDTLMVARS
jgi:alkylation response protein AidB-like acyl-CoA dehydrogenase